MLLVGGRRHIRCRPLSREIMLSDVVVEAQNHVDLVVPTPIARPVASCRGPCRTVQDKATIASDRARRGWPPVTSDTRCAGDERRYGTLFDLN